MFRLARGLLCVLIGSVGATVALSGEPVGEPAGQRLNVLMIAVDDLRPQLGCYGDRLVHSPHIDRLAARGLVFDRAYCQQALCSPSRIALLSGLRAETTGIDGIGPTLRSRARDVVTLPQLFKQHGYIARGLGKVYHVGIDDPQSWSVPSWHSPQPRYGPVGQAKVSAASAVLKKSGKKPPEKGPGRPFYAGPPFEHPDVSDDALLDGDTAREGVAALEELAAGRGEQPFFLAVGFANPHVPWVAPQTYWDLYHSADLPIPPNDFPPRDAPGFAAVSGADFRWYGGVPQGKLPPAYARDCLHGYLAAISYIDAGVGRLLDALDRSGAAEETVVILWGDHGYYMGEHGWWGAKHNNYEGATRAPLIVAVPDGRAAGRHTAALVEFMDIYPTLAELCGLPIPPTVEGTSFAPLLDAPDRAWKTAAFSSYPKGSHRGMAMRTDRYRYVEWRDKQGKLAGVELYDQQADPQNNQNLAAEAEPTLLQRLSDQLAAGWKAAQP